MTTMRGQPPGRAGRLWLERRVGVASRGGDLLEQKLRILLAERQRFTLLSERTDREWTAAVQEMDKWMLRAGMASGQRGLRLATPSESATAEVEWRLTMGVQYPVRARCGLPQIEGSEPVPDSTALLHARAAARRAVAAGVAHAVAAAALAAVSEEIASTRRQVRAVRRRWIPALESARQTLATALDDQEHDEAVRLRWANGVSRTPGDRP
ncbi:MAG: V-type ATP synthase subunit D [Candidatus Nanopelagicales bacterium]